ncbi:MAG: hypothetical protein BMS9Abin05_0462 [Rhodothermia bacterium]|nr:MAG: hypothetical protein BMS9Abin05_0462 [Rhodothermia bacterium]
MTEKSADRRKQSREIGLSLLVVFALVRTALILSPSSNLIVAGYSVHHLFTGILLLLVAGIPLVLGLGVGKMKTALNVIFGSGLALVMDEWIYLIATDGSDSSYLLPVSLWGGIVLVAFTAIYVALLGRK